MTDTLPDTLPEANLNTAPDASQDTPPERAPANGVAPESTAPSPKTRGPRGARGTGDGRGSRNQPSPKADQRAAPVRHHPVLDQLAELHPFLFGETPRPLKRGIFEDLLAAHPEVLERESLKAALALYARSSRYLTVVASGEMRHDLAQQPVEALTPEQVHHALIEVFRRRGARSREDLRPKLRQRIAQAFEASGLSAEAYVEQMNGRDDEVNQLTRDAVTESSQRTAREDALLRAFESSGKLLDEFADMYGLHVLDANRTLDRARARQQAAADPQAASGAVNTVSTPV
jgi:sRNA-binding protein